MIICGTLCSLWTIGKITKTFRLHTAATIANEPTINPKSKFFSSNLVTPKLFDFICFNIPDSNSNAEFVFRVCGQENDIVEIKHGDLYVNNILRDTQFKLIQLYSISQREYEMIEYSTDIDKEMLFSRTRDSLTFALEKRFLRENKMEWNRKILSTDFIDDEISVKFSKNWNQDNFGPIKVPSNSYFVLGDNRYNALDSRYLGFIKKENVTSTVLWTK